MSSSTRNPFVVWVPVILILLGGLWLISQLHQTAQPSAEVAARAIAMTAIAQISCAWLFAPWGLHARWSERAVDACIYTTLFMPLFALCLQIGDFDLLQLAALQVISLAAFLAHAWISATLRDKVSNELIRQVSATGLHWLPVFLFWLHFWPWSGIS